MKSLYDLAVTVYTISELQNNYSYQVWKYFPLILAASSVDYFSELRNTVARFVDVTAEFIDSK